MLKEINFETILPAWQKLWPERQSPIEPVSAINSEGVIDVAILGYTPTFFGYYENHRLVAVNSCHQTADGILRSRGLWVHPDFRGQGIASKMVLHLFAYAKINNLKRIWTMARHSSADFYMRLGFNKYGEISQYEFGPHVLCDVEVN